MDILMQAALSYQKILGREYEWNKNNARIYTREGKISSFNNKT